MKKIMTTLVMMLSMSIMTPGRSRAQSIDDLLKQLSLDYQKLAGLKTMLSQMYTGYEVLNKGYRAVQDVSEGNFNLHQAFLNGLLAVSPTVRNYVRVVDIVNNQTTVISEYRSAWSAFRQDKHFTATEISYMLGVYNHLISSSLKNIDDLSLILTDSKLRMSDAQRLTAIDHIYTVSQTQLSFLRKFNDQNYRTAVQRARDDNDRQTLRNLYGIN
ncbi:TerB family tellurite resistance protein [Mucilaginibacter robiniae]|uniref:TerB family tellurite resistance protein n=1 Tax=Mucilaginibacter robiniae TaxID=2728022 RepID=A0A7L5DYC5_9SPHI|nr:TerB family tellurite resistance protein [Mucilaginibacter robiniae]QJD96100.1 TerB family tellurite resistance protein [Mucilaginibacter robiniae]